MKKIFFLVGNETPLDLLLLSLFLKKVPPVELMLGVKRDSFIGRKKILKAWKVFRDSGMYFVWFNILLNSGIGRSLMQDDNTISPDIETLKEQYKFRLFYFDDVNDPKTYSTIKSFSPDIIFNHMPQRIRHPLTQLGIINIHPGLLPDYKGMGSCLWPLINKSSFHGTTLHYIDSDEIDAGPIIVTGRFPISEKDSVLSLHIKNRIAGAVLANYLTDKFIRNEEVSSKPQSGGRYYKLPKKESLKLMRDMGHRYFIRSDRKLLSENLKNQLEFSDKGTGWEWKKFEYMDTISLKTT